MKRIAVLVIAAVGTAVHRHYVSSYWTELIHRTADTTPHIDVYLLIEHGTPRGLLRGVADHVIEDPEDRPRRLLPTGFEHLRAPGILNKTVHALDMLRDEYDVYFRSNLSSMLLLDRFDRYVQQTDDLCYSGGIVWADALRDDLLHHDRVGPGRSVSSLADLEAYPGNTFVSGCGFFLNADEARQIVTERDRLRYDLPDDVAIGLMMPRHRYLAGFTEVLHPSMPIERALERIERTDATHLRLQHFPIERASALWHYLDRSTLWR